MKTAYRYPVLLLGLIILTACGESTPADHHDPTSTPISSPEKQKVLGASLLTQTHIFYQDLVAAMQEQAAKEGFTLRVQYCENDGTKQNGQIETYIVQGVDALIVSPVDSAAVAPVIADAQAKGIPVFTVDIAAYGAKVTSHIASDNVQGGRLIGEYLATALGGRGQIAIIDYPEVASVIDRVRGFEEALAKYPDMAIVARPPGYGQRDKAERAAQDMLQAHTVLDGIFGINDASALGALAAVEAAGRQEEIVIVGYDGTPEAREAILAGKALKADTVQHPEEIGRIAIETIAKHFRGEVVPVQIPVEVGIIDQAALAAPGA